MKLATAINIAATDYCCTEGRGWSTMSAREFVDAVRHGDPVDGRGRVSRLEVTSWAADGYIDDDTAKAYLTVLTATEAALTAAI
jgi:hypothetical protein